MAILVGFEPTCSISLEFQLGANAEQSYRFIFFFIIPWLWAEISVRSSGLLCEALCSGFTAGTTCPVRRTQHQAGLRWRGSRVIHFLAQAPN